uniref:75k gamma secalin n=1 Tax=Triticum aestivum TaxID=4565 RepID=E5KZU0_WHEAT|nr:75k gamma secalin [Triticum aestivum]
MKTLLMLAILAMVTTIATANMQVNPSGQVQCPQQQPFPQPQQSSPLQPQQPFPQQSQQPFPHQPQQSSPQPQQPYPQQPFPQQPQQPYPQQPQQPFPQQPQQPYPQQPQQPFPQQPQQPVPQQPQQQFPQQPQQPVPQQPLQQFPQQPQQPFPQQPQQPVPQQPLQQFPQQPQQPFPQQPQQLVPQQSQQPFPQTQQPQQPFPQQQQPSIQLSLQQQLNPCKNVLLQQCSPVALVSSLRSKISPQSECQVMQQQCCQQLAQIPQQLQCAAIHSVVHAIIMQQEQREGVQILLPQSHQQHVGQGALAQVQGIIQPQQLSQLEVVRSLVLQNLPTMRNVYVPRQCSTIQAPFASIVTGIVGH